MGLVSLKRVSIINTRCFVVEPTAAFLGQILKHTLSEILWFVT